MAKNDEIVKLVDSEGKEFDCRYIATVEYENEPYAILFPLQKVKGLPENSMIMLKMGPDESDGSIILQPVTDEKVQEGVNKKYFEMLYSSSCAGDCSSCGGCGTKK